MLGDLKNEIWKYKNEGTDAHFTIRFYGKRCSPYTAKGGMRFAFPPYGLPKAMRCVTGTNKFMSG
jgi:hypothetical protein